MVYDNTAPPSLITTETGLVARDHDYKDAYIKIQKIKQKGKSYYADACIQLAREKYDKKKCFSQYFQLYNQIING